MDTDSDESGRVGRRSWLESAPVPGTIPLPPHAEPLVSGTALTQASIRKTAGVSRLEAILDLILHRRMRANEQSPVGLDRDATDHRGS